MQLAIFDFDGTLVDTAPWFFRSFNTIARCHGLREINRAEGESLRGLRTREILSRLAVPMWKIPAIAADLRARAWAEASEIPLFPWVPGLSAALAEEGVRISIASSNSEAMIRQKLGDALPRGARIAAGASLFGKGRRLQQLVRSHSVTGSATICIGDEIRDIEAARQIGAFAVAVTWGLANREGLERAGPDELALTPEDLVQCLLTHASRR